MTFLRKEVESEETILSRSYRRPGPRNVRKSNQRRGAIMATQNAAIVNTKGRSRQAKILFIFILNPNHWTSDCLISKIVVK
ncbi:hypothetical protein TNCV_3965921 [Trichonephila clavipes]|nr:hypothetical protein TNCV_3965921 [Trichonephila clavipes]